MPTTASLDVWDGELAARHHDPHFPPPSARGHTPGAEDRRMERPVGYSEVDERGYRHLRDDAGEAMDAEVEPGTDEDAPGARVNLPQRRVPGTGSDEDTTFQRES